MMYVRNVRGCWRRRSVAKDVGQSTTSTTSTRATFDRAVPTLFLLHYTSSGRRRTIAVLLRLYTSLSSIAVAFSVTCIIRSELVLKVMKQHTVAITSYELFDVVRVALGVLLQMVVIATTTRLLQNMSPPKRAS